MSDDFDKYLAIANHDIQVAKNMGELKSYVANILYDNDKKVELLQQKENIIKEVREYMETIIKNTPSSPRKDYAHMILIDYRKFLEILDKENKDV